MREENPNGLNFPSGVQINKFSRQKRIFIVSIFIQCPLLTVLCLVLCTTKSVDELGNCFHFKKYLIREYGDQKSTGCSFAIRSTMKDCLCDMDLKCMIE